MLSIYHLSQTMV